jgi:hypothetical protein
MKPNLIEKKVLKRLLKKIRRADGKHTGGSGINMSNNLNNIISSIKENWYILLIIIFIIIIFVHLYIDNKKKKEQEQAEILNNKLKLESESRKNQKVETFKDGYVSEYYKMLPRVTNSPQIHEYRY